MRFPSLQTVLKVQANLTAVFGPYLSNEAEIIPPSAPGFPAQLQQRWTEVRHPTYGLGGIKPATEHDIQEIVKIAGRNDIPFFVTGGGHGVSDYHGFDGLALDLSNFKSVHISKDKTRLTIGGSVKMAQLIKPLYEAGREFPIGSCACVGVVGATLGGGISGLQGIHGTLLDLLESVRIITPEGHLLHASETENSDLFWGVRGAGSNFGVVTAATYVLPELSNGGMYLNADFVYPAGANASFFKVLQDFSETLPERLAISSVLVYNRVADEPMIAVNAIYYGIESEGRKAVQPFIDMQPTMSNLTMVPADVIMDAAFFYSFGGDNGACTPNQHINIYSMSFTEIHTPTWEEFYSKLVPFWKANPSFQGRWLLQRYPNDAVRKVGAEGTSYGHRQTKLFMNFEGFYENRSLDDAVNAFWGPSRDMFAKVSGYGGLRTYSNYARGDEGAAGWFGKGNLKKLVDLKKKWDPKGMFSVANAVPLEYSGEEEYHRGL